MFVIAEMKSACGRLGGLLASSPTLLRGKVIDTVTQLMMLQVLILFYSRLWPQCREIQWIDMHSLHAHIAVRIINIRRLLYVYECTNQS